MNVQMKKGFLLRENPIKEEPCGHARGAGFDIRCIAQRYVNLWECYCFTFYSARCMKGISQQYLTAEVLQVVRQHPTVLFYHMLIKVLFHVICTLSVLRSQPWGVSTPFHIPFHSVRWSCFIYKPYIVIALEESKLAIQKFENHVPVKKENNKNCS